MTYEVGLGMGEYSYILKEGNTVSFVEAQSWGSSWDVWAGACLDPPAFDHIGICCSTWEGPPRVVGQSGFRSLRNLLLTSCFHQLSPCNNKKNLKSTYKWTCTDQFVLFKGQLYFWFIVGNLSMRGSTSNYTWIFFTAGVSVSNSCSRVNFPVYFSRIHYFIKV